MGCPSLAILLPAACKFTVQGLGSLLRVLCGLFEEVHVLGLGALGCNLWGFCLSCSALTSGPCLWEAKPFKKKDNKDTKASGTKPVLIGTVLTLGRVDSLGFQVQGAGLTAFLGWL